MSERVLGGEQAECALGTERRDGSCVPVAWDPALVHCDAQACSVPRDFVEARDGKESVALQGLRAVPAADAEGNWLGVRLFGVREGSIAHTVGLRSGDVVGEINGVELTSMAASEPLELQLFGEKVASLRFSFERGGEPKTLVVNLVD